MNSFRVSGKWLHPIPKKEANYLQNLGPKLFQDHNKLVWVRLNDYQYPRTARYLPAKYRKLALCEAHNNQFGGHNAALKTYIRISSSYFWPKIYIDVLNHTKTCFRCQQRKSSKNKPLLLQPLPIPDSRLPFWANARCRSQCSLPDRSTNTSSASQTPSPNMGWSRLWRTKKLRLWQKPFFQNGFVNSASRR
jgi:hypothetical protein